jgi:hypothetical protein
MHSHRRHISAVDVQNLSRNVGGCVRAEKYGGTAQIVESTESVLRDSLQHVALPVYPR